MAIVFAVLNLFAQKSESNSLQIARKIADNVVNETIFALRDTKQKPVLDIQVIDFPKIFKGDRVKQAFAIANISVEKNIKLSFGVSYSQPIQIWINNKLKLNGSDIDKFYFKETAYSMFCFQDTFAVDLQKGMNEIIIMTSSESLPVIFLRELTRPNEKVQSRFLNFSSNYGGEFPWGFISADELRLTFADKSNSQKDLIDKLFNKNIISKLNVMFESETIIKELSLNHTSTFNKEAFTDWSYPNGILMMAIMELSKATGNESYNLFVKKYCSFIRQNEALFKKQYFVDHDLRTGCYRMFRMSMLDDAGAPALPFAEVSIQDKIHDYDSLLFASADYIMNDQPRLKDGTFCRPEPEKRTIWADDLFMSVPFLTRMAILKKDDRYFNLAAKQIINFHKYLYNQDKKLYSHGWFSSDDKQSGIYWGRANGWILWAESGFLSHLPRKNKYYNKVKKIFVNHIYSILKYQDKDGMWHQVLDDKRSFEETSCTAMFIEAISQGIMLGIINKKLSANVFKAWTALKTKINPDGDVKDISCGTGLGYNKKFYETRKRFDNDPRGLGAVICAAIEVTHLENYLSSNASF